MLSKPEHGWSTVSFEDFEAPVSYLVDVPFDWLRTCINGLKYNTPIALHIDEEGIDDLITSYWFGTYVIVQDWDDKETLHTYEEINYIDIAYMLYQDVKLYFEDWVHWSPFEDRPDDIIRRRKELQQLLDEIKQLLISKAKGNNRNYPDLSEP